MRRVGLAAILALSLPAAALAQGMPQLDFSNPLTTAQVVWLAIIFTVLYLLLARWALPKVADVLDLRAASIGRDLEAARQAKADSDSAVADLVEATRQARAEAHAEVAQAVAAAKAGVEAEAAELHARLEAQLVEAEGRIEAARAAAMSALREVATETAAEVISRLTGRPASTAAVAAAVGDTLAARGLG
jgi:F-type H+-transporting ATPase subunit b